MSSSHTIMQTLIDVQTLYGLCQGRVSCRDNLISRLTKQQPTFSRSIAEVKYRAVGNVLSWSNFLRNHLLEPYCHILKVTLVYCDNVSTLCISRDLVQHQCIKHIEMNINFVLENVTHGQVCVLHVPSYYQQRPSSIRVFHDNSLITFDIVNDNGLINSSLGKSSEGVCQIPFSVMLESYCIFNDNVLTICNSSNKLSPTLSTIFT